MLDFVFGTDFLFRFLMSFYWIVVLVSFNLFGFMNVVLIRFVTMVVMDLIMNGDQ